MSPIVSAMPTPPYSRSPVASCNAAVGMLDLLVQHRHHLIDVWRIGLGPDAAVLLRSDACTEPMAHVVDALLSDLLRQSREPMIAPE
ncbi:MAG: hypothetical protein LH467_15665 [Gemmatimonadaceae bacterium]|nr:hypothetical protein [Gemmatimonadaceae bacterium]